MRPTEEVFRVLADDAHGMLQPGERFLLNVQGEESDFVRFNHARIRQAGRVHQRSCTLTLIADGRHASATSPLSGVAADDRSLLASVIGRLRTERAVLDVDPHLLYSESPESSLRTDADHLPDSVAAVHALLDGAAGLDLVGLWAAGSIQRGFANSFGQCSWHSVHTFNASWSSHRQGDRSVSGSYAGSVFDAAELGRKLERTRSEASAQDRPSARITPGRFRAYIAPSALLDLLGLLSWNGFSLKAHRTSTSSLLRLASGEVHLHPAVALSEDRRNGLSPGFTSTGFVLPSQVPLVTGGRLDELLVSPRSAREYGRQPNADAESPESLVMAGGALPDADMLAQLGTGLWISNLWYCNFSDPNACRITGMTRFACWYVENGEIQAPLPVMRFDDSLYGLLGERLLGISITREHLLSNSTYGGRALDGMLLPGVLVEGLNLTL
jgi:predicted Zn-dependent protease